MRNMLLVCGLMVGLIACAPAAGVNNSKNPYKAERYESLSTIAVKSGTITYATVAYSEKYWDGDFSKLVDKSVQVSETPREGDVYASELSGMLTVNSVSPAAGVDVQIAYVEARREIDSLYNTYDESGYYYYDSIDVTYRIKVEKDIKEIPMYYTVGIKNNYKNQDKSVLLRLSIDGRSFLTDLLKDDEETPKKPETPETPTKPETPENK